MTEMVYGAVPAQSGDPILPRWWRTIDKWSVSCILILFGIGILLGLAASPPLAERNGLGYFHYVERQLIFGVAALITMFAFTMVAWLCWSIRIDSGLPVGIGGWRSQVDLGEVDMY